MFSRRTHWELSPNKITMLLESLREQGATMMDLTESNLTRCKFLYPQNEILDALSSAKNLQYTPSPQGNLEARQAVCAYYKKKNVYINPGQVFLTASTSEAYSFLFRLLAEPQDSILFPRPSYPLFQFLVDLNDLKHIPYPLIYDGKHGWQIDIEGFYEALQADTKAVVLVNPNNPTGSFVYERELTRINAICRHRELAIICDEVFLDYVFEPGAAHFSLAGNQDALTFVMGGISKSLGLPQMKLSWIVVNGPQEMVAAAMARLEIICDTYLSVNTPVQHALPQWFALQSGIQQEILHRIQRNQNFLLDHLYANAGCSCLRTRGGWYAVLKLSKNYMEDTLVEELLLKDQVFVHPGYFFDFNEEPFLILSLLPPEEIFQEGVRRLLRRLTVN